MNDLKLNARWTDDCQGKKDYDGPILVVSTRYWPRGGGFWIINNKANSVSIEDDSTRPEIKPSASCSLDIVSKQEGYAPGEHTTIATRDFEGETFEEVSAQVEAWAQAAMNHAVAALCKAFEDP